MKVLAIIYRRIFHNMTKEDRNKIAHGIIGAKELCKYCANYEKCSNFIQGCKNFQLVLSEKMGNFDR